MGVQISPSILSADFARLADDVAAVGEDADWVHVDVMDNHFVPNLTLGLPVVEAILKSSSLPVDCHLMIEDPDRWAPGYAEAGAASVTFHVEAAQAPVRLARTLRAAGARAGMALKPATPVVDTMPKGTASPNACVAWSTSPDVQPASTRTVLLAGSTRTLRINERSMTSPLSQLPRPGPLWPPPRRATSSPFSRPKFTAVITSATSTH